ncbi:MAG: DUF2806 domain-containing protein [Desulfovibrio sp.]|nr:DUF2806 domain-containing protein [Desulfovibrio sp.]
MQKDDNNNVNIGHTIFTKIGQELAPICGSQPVDGFMDYVKEQWNMYSPKILKTEPFKR